MATKNKNLSLLKTEHISGAGLKIGIVVSEWNGEITEALYEACNKTLRDYEVDEDQIYRINVPGAYELPLGARTLLTSEQVDAVICLGCVIKGETKHDEYISNAIAQGMMTLGLTSGKAIVFGVLTTNSMEQALDRAGGKHGNKGVEAAITAIKMALLKKNTKSTKKGIGF